MKKLFVLLLLILALVMTACAPEEEEPADEKDEATEEKVSEEDSNKSALLDLLNGKIDKDGNADETPDNEGTETEPEGDVSLPTEPEYPEYPEYPEEPETPQYVINVDGVFFENGETQKTFEYGDEVFLTADDREDAAFLFWEKNGEVVTADKTVAVTVEEDSYLKAVYAEAGTGELEFNTDDGKTYYVAGIGNVNGDVVVIPDTYNGKPVTRIAMTAFKGNTYIRMMILPEGMTSIGKDAFDGCTSLEYINLPSTLTELGENEFSSCTSLITAKIGIDMTSNWGMSNLKTAFITNNVDVINFNGNGNLVSVFLPAGVKAISDYSFAGCVNLKNINLPNDLERIGEGAFSGCVSLNVALPQGLKYIGKSAFMECTSLSSAVFTENLEELGDSAFYECKNLTVINIPSKVTAIPNYAFARCFSLVSVSMGSKVTSIGTGAFERCSSLSHIELPESLDVIGDAAFLGCAFTELSLPHSVSQIGTSVFEDCKALKTLRLSESLDVVSSEALKGCEALTELYVCANTSMSMYTYESGRDNSGLTVYFNGTQSEFDEKYGANHRAFEGATVKLQANTLYDFDTGFRYTSNGDGTCHIGRIPTVEITATEITIPEKSPNGDTITHIDRSTFESNKTLERIVIEAPVTSISEYTLRYCPNLKSVILPNTVRKIEDCAFQSNSKLVEINLPAGLFFIGDYAFSDCEGFVNLPLPNGVEIIGESAFSGCDNLKSVTLGENIKTVGYSVFLSCNSLETINLNCTEATFPSKAFSSVNANVYYGKSVEDWLNINSKNGILTGGMTLYIDGAPLTDLVIPQSVTKIPDYAFAYCNTLKSITFHEGVTEIGIGAFLYCEALEEIILGDGITSVAMDAFTRCGNVSRLIIPEGLTYLSEYAFNSTALGEIYYKGTRDQWYAVDSLKRSDISSRVYKYSETAPEGRDLYWHYVDGEMVKW